MHASFNKLLVQADAQVTTTEHDHKQNGHAHIHSINTPLSVSAITDAGRGVRPTLKTLFITRSTENAAIGNGHLDPGMQILTKPFAIDMLLLPG